MITGPVVQRLLRFSLTTADADRLAVFYASTFGCRRLATEYLSGPAFETLMGVKGGALRITLSLGEQIVELLQFDRQGKPYPNKGSASDLIFQHFAIVVCDMAEACRRLSAMDGWAAISRDGPQRLPEASGGVTAFKFRDPEGHPLEFLFFPEGAVPSRWRKRQNGEIFLGIDHSAISISNTARSISFYENLGFRMSAHSLNQGAEQENLDDVAGAKAEVTALMPRESGPHVELLCYRETPPNREAPHSNADIATARLVFESSEFSAPHHFADPDGHHVIVEGPALRETLTAE